MNQSRKRAILCAVVLALLCTLSAKAQTLVLYHANGTTTDIQLYTQPRIEFKNDQVVITSPVLSMEYPKEDVLRFTYKGNTTVGVDAVKRDANFSQDSHQLVFHGVKKSDAVAVYTLNGVRVPVHFMFLGNDATLSLQSIPKGAFILSINGRTSKFTKR